MYEDRTQNYYPEIQKEYLIHDTPFPLPGQWQRHGLKCGYAESEYEAQMAKRGGGGFLEKRM